MPAAVEDLPRAETRKLPRAPRLKGRARFILAGAVIVLIAAAAWAYFHFRNRVSTDDAQVDAHITVIAPRVPGTVAEVLVNDNQNVKVGDPLVRIDPRDYEARVNQAKAAVEQALSQLRTARTTVPLTQQTTQSGTSAAAAQLQDAMAGLERARQTAEQASTSEVAGAEAAVRSRQAAYDRAQADLARMKPLLDKAEISQQQYDAYVAAARVAESDLRSAQQKLVSTRQSAEISLTGVKAAESRVNQARAQMENSQANRRQVDVRQAEAGSAAAGVEAARANLAAAELQLSYTNITAPVDGTVTHKTVEPGQTVQAGQALMTIIPLRDVWVTANFKETQLAGVRPGQRVEIDVDMYGRTVEGHVDSIAGATGSKLSLLPPENATGNFVKVVQRIPVKILVDQTHGLVLRPGMNVSATIFTK
jgi:membrane fusion protein (multidrug efflux system)